MDEKRQPSTENSGEWEFPSNKELGTRLKNRRREMGLTLTQISEQTRVGVRHLEALENEDWASLPSPAFVRGFIRSYGRVLELPTEGLIVLYEESAPPPQGVSKPVQAAPKRKPRFLYIIVVIVVLVGGFAAYSYKWTGLPFLNGKITQEDSSVSVEERSDDLPSRPESPPDREEAISHPVEAPAGSLEMVQEPAQEASARSPVPGGEDSTEKPADAPQQTEGPASSASAAIPGPEPTAMDSEPASEDIAAPLTLKATVKERVWVRVIIDGETTRESTFDRGSTHEWRAHKGFELLIGNAGGLDLEFNGKPVENLGKRGQVVRLKLPPKDAMNGRGE